MRWHNMISSPIALQLFYVLEVFTKYFTLLFAVFTEFPYDLQNNSKAQIFLWDLYLAVAFCIMTIPRSCLDIKQTNLIHYSLDFKSCNRLWTHLFIFFWEQKKNDLLSDHCHLSLKFIRGFFSLLLLYYLNKELCLVSSHEAE